MQDPIMRAIEQSPNFMALGGVLKTLGIKYDFIMLDMLPPHYKIKAGQTTWIICNPKYADDEAIIVNGMALEIA